MGGRHASDAGAVRTRRSWQRNLRPFQRHPAEDDMPARWEHGERRSGGSAIEHLTASRVRDIGPILGVSHHRVSQVLARRSAPGRMIVGRHRPNARRGTIEQCASRSQLVVVLERDGQLDLYSMWKSENVTDPSPVTRIASVLLGSRMLCGKFSCVTRSTALAMCGCRSCDR